MAEIILEVSKLFPPSIIKGNREAVFTELAVNGADGNPDAAFIWLEGKYFPEAERILQAQQLGSSVFIAREFPVELEHISGLTLIQVNDPLQELIRLSTFFREKSNARVIGITGSSGKTTTKDMVAHILRGRYKKTLKTYRNYNGELGVALTLRKLRPDDQFAVIEIGLGEPGSVAQGAALCKPDVGIITGIGESHIGKFSSLQHIAREKGSLLQALPQNGLSILNGDDPYCKAMRGNFSGRSLTFGLDSSCDFSVSEIEQVAYNMLRFKLTYEATPYEMVVPAVGDFQALNAAAAIAVGLDAGLSLAETSERLLTFRPGDQRLRPYTFGNVLVVDDAYNASPQGMSMSIKSFASIPWVGPKIAILGDMQDQDKHSAHYYAELSRLLTHCGFEKYILLGDSIKSIAPSLKNCTLASSAEQAASLAYESATTNGAILLKSTDDRLFSRVRDILRALYISEEV